MTTRTVPSAGAGEKRTFDPRIEGLRALAAMGVLLYHIAMIAGVTRFGPYAGDGIWGFLTDGMQVCLPIFFVLSGVLLFRPFARWVVFDGARPSMASYWWRRGLRLLPAYWLATLAALMLLNFNSIDSPLTVLRPLLLLHFYLPGGPELHGLGPTWTVPAEMFFYLMLPVCAWLGIRYARRGSSPAQRMRRLFIPLVGLVVVGFGWTTFTNWPSTQAMVIEYDMWFWPFYFVDTLAAGMALATWNVYVEKTGADPAFYRFVRRWPNACWIAAVVVFLLNCTRPIGIPGNADYPALFQELLIHALIFAFALLIIAPLTVPNSGSRTMSALLTTAPVRYLGRIAYGLYLWHDVVSYLYLRKGSVFGDTVIPPGSLYDAAPFWELAVFVIGGTIAVATLSHYALERPLINRFGDKFKPPQPKLQRTSETGLAPNPG